MADAGVGVLPIHRRSGSRSSRAMGARDPKDRRRRRTSTARRRLVALAALALAALVLRAVAYLASWYPGDETIRASSESFLRLMFSRSGVSFGKTKSFAFSKEVTIDAGDSIKLTQKAAVVQGEISRRPRWRAGEDVNVTRHAELEWNADEKKSCFFRVHADAPAITFFDDGVTRVWRLRGLDELQLVRAAKGRRTLETPYKRTVTRKRKGRETISEWTTCGACISAPRRPTRGRGFANPGAYRPVSKQTRRRYDRTRSRTIRCS
jgi:hypothetical protein